MIRIFKNILLIINLLAVASFATPARRITVEQAVNESEIIVIGDVGQGLEVGKTKVSIYGTEYDASEMSSSILIRDVLKGRIAAAEIHAQWIFPRTPSGGVGYYSLIQGRRIVFLKEKNGVYQIANPGLPSVPSGEVSSSTVDVLEAVLERLSAASLDYHSNVRVRREAVGVLQLVSNYIVKDTFRQLLRDEDPELQLNAITGLLQRNEWTILKDNLPMFVTGPPPNYPWYATQNLASAVASGITAPQSIPYLGKILTSSTEVKFRRSAAFALRKTKQIESLKYLAKSLNDVDQQVRYESVIGFGDIIEKPEWRPLEEEYKKDEGKYLKFWRMWVSEKSPTEQ